MATPLLTPLRRSWDNFNQRPVWLLASSDPYLDGTVMAIGEANVYGQVRTSANNMNARRAALGLSPIPV